ncbi:MAG: 50S ribosomal protein L9 [Rhodospirillales bacterium]|jgi:large subunit ribosomal protein L9|nr:50S ribosomal protein L9 [Rhodospirillales bacterium]MBT4038913.1 50S ribosomal protein L9 [Rhodospirillales bacterium]MBT4625248.1 50S ribosomal protein L9 [Rhodospirillales bacterium]MBT5351011.1 50S ribosomal protein L9 [Rhodospirillales bacterium]MBT5521269.1 50S ribosomal protein L9 [Rhodospirillales bacterium]
MEVILLERIEKLGQMGDVVNVKTGYARNFLLPKKKALRATEANKSHFDGQRAQLEADNLTLKNEAVAVGEKLEGQSVILVRQAGDAGQLYGSVSARDIAGGLTEEGFTVTATQVILGHPIKTLGIHAVSVVLHPEVSVTVDANVARTQEEAEIQAKTGSAVLSMEQQEAAVADAAADADAAAAALAAAEEIFDDGAAPEEAEEAADDTAEAEETQEATDGEEE